MIAAAYFGAVAYLYAYQRDYVFKPTGRLETPMAVGLNGVEVLSITAKDGTELTGWHAEPKPGRPTLLYFHGNAGSLSERADRFKQVLASGFGLMAFSYRGYAGSGGSPSEASFFSDALEIFDRLAMNGDDIVIHGESLGTAVATYVASKRKARALILEAPFTAALDIAHATYPWVPVSILMRDPFLTRDLIRQVDEPVLIVHGTADAVVPVDYGRRLFAAAHEPKQLALIAGAGHADLWERGLWTVALEFLRENRVIDQPEAEVRRIPSFAG